MRLAATDEDGSATVAVTSGATTLLSTELLAGARHVRALPRRATRSTALFKLPCHHAMQNISARFQSKYRVIQLDIAATFGVEGLNLDLHSLALLPFCSFRRHSRFSLHLHGSLIAIFSIPQACRELRRASCRKRGY